jgi:hypothetical protein
MPEESRTRRLAILIDADNTSPRIAAGLFEEVAKFGEPSVQRTLPHVANSTFSFVAFDCFVLITTTATPRSPPNEGT